MTPVARELLVRGMDDWVDLSELPYYARRIGGAADASEERRLSLDAVKLLLESGLWIAGVIGKTAFAPWDMTTAAALRRIEDEWQPPDRPLEFNEICWFANTERGDAYGKRLVEAGYKTLEDD